MSACIGTRRLIRDPSKAARHSKRHCDLPNRPRRTHLSKRSKVNDVVLFKQCYPRASLSFSSNSALFDHFHPPQAMPSSSSSVVFLKLRPPSQGRPSSSNNAVLDSQSMRFSSSNAVFLEAKLPSSSIAALFEQRPRPQASQQRALADPENQKHGYRIKRRSKSRGTSLKDTRTADDSAGRNAGCRTETLHEAHQ
ncbi:hypothetical protein BDR22DRAFT_891462 [Usnea florida]